MLRRITVAFLALQGHGPRLLEPHHARIAWQDRGRRLLEPIPLQFVSTALLAHGLRFLELARPLLVYFVVWELGRLLGRVVASIAPFLTVLTAPKVLAKLVQNVLLQAFMG